MKRKLELSGKVFGRLTVIEKCGKIRRMVAWRCMCKCGVEKVVSGSLLVNGQTLSCGCLRIERQKEAVVKHGQARTNKKTKEFFAWISIRNRCYNENYIQYKDYGGRGIRVCDRWKDSFKNFLEDMGEKPNGRYSLDRYPDNNGNYEPSNCRWATQKEQTRNRRNNVWIEHGEERMVLSDWASRFGINRATLVFYLKKDIFKNIYDRFIKNYDAKSSY